MPGGDRTGPMGTGAMSGRGFGDCSGNQFVGAASQQPIYGRRFLGGRNFGAGRGNRNMFYAADPSGWQRASPSFQKGENDLQASGNEEGGLRAELERLKQRLEELEKQKQ